MRVSKATLFTFLILIVSIGLAMVLKNGAAGEASAEGAVVLAPVRVVAIRPRTVTGEIVVGGFLRARADVTISAERAGRLVGLPVAEGERIERGTVVARLDDTVAAANLEQARAAAREAGLDPEVPAAELERARANLSRAVHELALHHPASPLAGVIEVHHVDEGEYVTPGTPLVDVLDTSRLVLDVDVDAEIVGLIRRSSVTVMGKSAAIARIAGRADAVTRRFRVELQLLPGALRPGMHATATFALPASEEAFFVPKSSVRESHGETGAFVVRDAKATWVPLSVEAVHHLPRLWRVVKGGLRTGDQLVTAGFSGLRDGAPVQAQEQR